MALQVPFTGEEKISLRTSLDRHRDVVLWKIEGLDDERLRSPMTSSGTSLLGLVKHLAAVEYGWFCETLGPETEPLPFDEDDPEATFGSSQANSRPTSSPSTAGPGPLTTRSSTNWTSTISAPPGSAIRCLCAGSSST
jgi:hypothetical protein